jgi:hypothetical protein
MEAEISSETLRNTYETTPSYNLKIYIVKMLFYTEDGGRKFLRNIHNNL